LHQHGIYKSAAKQVNKIGARLSESVSARSHTYFMHDLTLARVLNAQRENATLAGHQLRAAARDLIDLSVNPSTFVLTYDDAGQRIVGAALALDDAFPVPFDTTAPLPPGAVCLLVGGVIAGPLGVAELARLARNLGAAQVNAAVLGGWSDPISGINCVHPLASTCVTAA
jgi:hypothetical protein